MRQILSLALFFAGALRADTALVLSFFNHAKNANLDWVGESIAQSVRDSLASEGILVLDREDRSDRPREENHLECPSGHVLDAEERRVVHRAHHRAPCHGGPLDLLEGVDGRFHREEERCPVHRTLTSEIDIRTLERREG